MAEEANIFSAGDNRVCSNRRDREDKHNNSTPIAEDRVGTMQPIRHGGGQGEKLLCLWKIWAHGPPLQESGRKGKNGREKNGTGKGKVQGQHGTNRIFKRGGELRSPQLSSYNKFNVLDTEIDASILKPGGTKKKVEVRKAERKPVVATTHRNGTRSLLTSAKLSVGYLVVGITRELNKELSLYCSSIYINTM